MIPAALSPLANHLWQSTLFAAVAGLVTQSLRRNRAAVRYGLWFAASVKFLVPFSWLVLIGRQFGWRSVVMIAGTNASVAMEHVFVPQVLAAAAPAAATPSAVRYIPALLAAVWAVGVVAVLVSWWREWRLIRTALRRATPLRAGALSSTTDIAVMSSPDLLEPGIIGIWRPVLLLPEGIADALTPLQFNAILAHEWCHVRRRDNLAAGVHMMVEALYWFHPLVWWLEARLIDEREQACDEEVLRAGNDPDVYAESLLRVCRFYIESPLACASGVTGADLKKRIEAIMVNRITHPLNVTTKLLLALVSVAAIAGPMIVGALNAPRLRAQSPASEARPLAFEVASVKTNQSGDHRTSMRTLPGGRIEGTNRTLTLLIQNAYRLQDFQMAGGPDWLDRTRFDISAKAEGNSTQAELQSMLRTLLVDRFKLTVHTETRQLPIYLLSLVRPDGKLGPQLRTSEADCRDRRPNAPPPAPSEPPIGQAPRCGFRDGAGSVIGGGVNMEQLAAELTAYARRPVMDRTGLNGDFDLTLNYTPDAGLQPPNVGSSAEPSSVNPDVPSIFTAVREQLGLKLEPTKGPVDVLVIDHAEKPTED